jgi:hypothetical protein
MKINEVTETTPTQKKLANIGRALMTHSETASMKGADDAKIGMFNQMSSLGNELTKFGTTFGPKDLQGLMKATGLNAATIKTLLAFGEKLAAKGVAPKVADLDPEDEPQDDFGGPSDDEIDAQARQAAMGK